MGFAGILSVFAANVVFLVAPTQISIRVCASTKHLESSIRCLVDLEKGSGRRCWGTRAEALCAGTFRRETPRPSQEALAGGETREVGRRGIGKGCRRVLPLHGNCFRQRAENTWRCCQNLRTIVRPFNRPPSFPSLAHVHLAALTHAHLA